jgi:hypothetical protein
MAHRGIGRITRAVGGMPPRAGKMQPGVNALPPGARAGKMSAQANRGMDPSMLHRVFQSPRKRNEGCLESTVAPLRVESRHVLCDTAL